MKWQLSLRTVLLLLLFVALVMVFFALQKWLLGGPFNLLFTNLGTQYLLSAIAQSEAAIIGLVVTVTLVAAQLSVAAYIPRVISVFRRHVDLWLLILIYGASMSFSLLLLNVSTPSVATRENMIILAYSTFPAAFLMLIPYISGTLRALEPSSVMESLLRSIPLSSSRATSSHLTARQREKSLDNALVTIEDMICASFRKGDYATGMMGLTGLVDRITHAAKLHSGRTKKLGWRFPRYVWYDTYLASLAKHLRRPGRILAEVDRELCSRLIGDLLEAGWAACSSPLSAEEEILGAIAAVGKRAVALGDRENAITAMKGIAQLSDRISFSKSRVHTEDRMWMFNRYVTVIESVISSVIAIGGPGTRRWGQTFAIDFCGCLAGIGMVYATKRYHRNDNPISSFPNDEPIMRVLVALDHALVDSLLGSNVPLSTYVGEPLLHVRVIKPLVTIAQASYQKGYWEYEGLNDFGRAVRAICDIGAAASLNCSDGFLTDIADVLADLASLDRKIVLEQLQFTMSRHFLLSKLDLSHFREVCMNRIKT